MGLPVQGHQERAVKLFLVGMPGSGKTTIGRQLSRRREVPFVDTDQVIEARLGCSIREYFEHCGEEAFREVEQQVLDELTASCEGVLSTGGGAVLRGANRQHLHARGQVIYLYASAEDLYRRLRHDTARPLLQVEDPLARLRSLLAARDPLYRQAAHFVLETGRPSLPPLVNMILMQVDMAAAAMPTPAPAGTGTLR